MLIDTSIRSGDEKVDAYIQELEAELTSFEASNARRLISSLDGIMGTICDDIDIIASGDELAHENEDGVLVSKLNVLNSSKDDKLFERIMALFSKISSIRDVYDTSISMRVPVKEVEKEAKELEKEKSKLNAYEQVIKSKKR